MNIQRVTISYEYSVRDPRDNEAIRGIISFFSSSWQFPLSETFFLFLFLWVRMILTIVHNDP